MTYAPSAQVHNAEDSMAILVSRPFLFLWRMRCRPIVLLALVLAACDTQKPQPPQQPPTVFISKVELKDINEERTFTGRIEAIEKVPLRARVQGFLTSRNFEEGAEVKKGAVLYEIDRLPFEIAVKQAEANLANADAALKLAQLTYDRQFDLSQRNSAAASKAQLDQAQAALAQAQAQKQARQAELQTAQVNLGYTNILAPFDGRIGRSNYAVGDLVGPSSNPLATIVQQDPIYVTFPVPQRILLETRRSNDGADAFYVRLRLADGSYYGERGRIQFVDVQATSSTDSVIVRASIPNPDGILLDQQLVEVSVVRSKPQPRLMMPQSALLLDQQGAFALAVSKENKVEQRRIVVGQQVGPMIIVESGLSAGDSVIVSGLRNARPGIVVSPQLEAPIGQTHIQPAPPTSPQSKK
ncbi:MAG: efflux RND transporter periplasmic adaptor subunit [Hyphomicrobiaceae bacterium]